MLLALEIEGLAVIEKVRLDLHPGLNVLTGETGAGKSVLIRALHLLCGGKAYGDTVRAGSPHASVSGTFLVSADHNSHKVLQDLGLPGGSQDKDGSGVLILRRQVKDTGRSSAWINDVSVTAASMRKVSETLIDIFAQHDNQRLLDESLHLSQLDAFLDSGSQLEATRSTWNQIQTSLSKLRQFSSDYQEKLKTRDYLEFRLGELDGLDPSDEDYQSLIEQCRNAEQSMAARERYQNALSILESGYQSKSLAMGLWDCLQTLEDIADQDPQRAMTDRIKQAAIDLEDLTFELNQRENLLSRDDDDFEATQERLAKYQSVMRKLQVESCEDLIAEQNRLKSSLEFLAQAKQTVSDLLYQILSQCKQLHTYAEKLSKERCKVAKKLEIDVASEFKELAMPAARLFVAVEPHKPISLDLNLDIFGQEFLQDEAKTIESIRRLLEPVRAEGLDKVRFLMVTNKGESPKPLARIASGGEVSRVMLALKRAMIAEKKTCILVFDEIDTGISGRIASKVGKKLKDISSQVQVICISHLAQVAAWAGYHYSVRKKGKGGKTWVELISLDGDDRIEELARLLSGETVTPMSMENAKSLLEANQ